MQTIIVGIIIGISIIYLAYCAFKKMKAKGGCCDTPCDPSKEEKPS